MYGKSGKGGGKGGKGNKGSGGAWGTAGSWSGGDWKGYGGKAKGGYGKAAKGKGYGGDDGAWGWEAQPWDEPWAWGEADAGQGAEESGKRKGRLVNRYTFVQSSLRAYADGAGSAFYSQGSDTEYLSTKNLQLHLTQDNSNTIRTPAVGFSRRSNAKEATRPLASLQSATQ